MVSITISNKENKANSATNNIQNPRYMIPLVVWQFTAAFLWLIGLIAALLYAYPFSPGYEAHAINSIDIFGMVTGTILLSGFMVLALVSGFGLIRRKKWARNASVINTAISLFLVPFGLVFGTLLLIYLKNNDLTNYFNDTDVIK